MIRKALLLICLSIACLDGFGWGATGHRATGLIAERYLNAKAKKRLAKILEGQSLAMVSTWMDEVRSDSLYNFMEHWHYTTVPDGKRYQDIASNPDGKAVQMIEKIIQDLKSKKLSEKQEREYVKVLVHLIGDIHQPLHVGRPGDRGGNDVKVKWFRNESNLHRVWDSDMIDDTKLSYTELANSFVLPDNLVVKKWQATVPQEWANESTTYRTQVYAIGNGTLGYSYSYKYFNIAKLRMLQAGIRLGTILNQIYGK